jgi:class 3 adenylate cyclase
MPAVAGKSDLDAGDLRLRFGLHWGSSLYVGQIATSARTEVTALGDQVNEAARIEACAGGGLMLASKDVVERLTPGDAAGLGLDPDHMTYRMLADLDAETGKARRDAPVLAVCEI